MSIWTVQPEEVKYDLTYTDDDGLPHPFWVRMKKALTVGEQRRVMTAGWKGMGGPDGGIQIDWRKQTFARSEIYLTGWSLTLADDKPMPLTRDALESLQPAVYELIEGAINAHVTAREEEKKLRSGSASPSQT